jgi:hypothetical protein
VQQPSFYTDSELRKRWRCSTMKLWRLRKAGKLHSIQLGGRGYPWLTSAEEVARIEAALPTPSLARTSPAPMPSLTRSSQHDRPVLGPSPAAETAAAPGAETAKEAAQAMSDLPRHRSDCRQDRRHRNHSASASRPWVRTYLRRAKDTEAWLKPITEEPPAVAPASGSITKTED